MVTTLPSASGAAFGSPGRAKQERLPTAADVPQVRSPSDPGLPSVRVPSAAFGGPRFEGLEDVGRATLDLGQRLIAAEDRSENRRRSVSNARKISEYNAFSRDMLRNAELEGDLSDEEQRKEIRTQLQTKREELLASTDEIQRADLEPRMLQMESTFVDDLAVKGVIAERKLATDTMKAMLSERVEEIDKRPSSYAEQIRGIQGDIALFAGNLTAAEERAIFQGSVSVATQAAVASFAENGDFDEAEDILADPETRQALGEENWQRMRDRVRDARQEIGDRRFEESMRTLQLQTAQVGLERARVGLEEERLKAAGAVRPAILDATGALKREASGEARRQVAQLLGGTYNIQTGQTSGLDPEASQAAVQMNAEVERILESGEEDSISQAISLASGRIALPERLSFEQIADQSLENLAKEKPSQTEIEQAPELAASNRESLINLRDATGIRSGLVDAIMNNVVGQINPLVVNTDVVEGRRRLALLENDFISAFKRSPRLPVWEQVRLSRIFSGPSIIRSPEGMRSELRVIDDLLTQEIESRRQILKSPVSNEAKQQALNDILAMAQFRARARDFDVTPAVPEKLQTPADVNKATPEQIQAWLDVNGDEAINSLPLETRQALFERLGGASEAESMPTVGDQEGVDALEPGTEFIWGPTGERFRKD